MENLIHIIHGCISNEPKCQKTLYERFYGYALKIVFRYIYRYEKAVDVVNDGYVKLFRAFKNFQYNNEEDIEKIFMGWIRRIMVNTAIDELRRSNMMPEIGGIPEYVWEEADKSSNADQTILYKELIEQVKHLPPSYRAVFNMYVIDGFTHQEIADQLGISVCATKTNQSKSRAHLKKKNNDGYQEADICSL